MDELWQSIVDFIDSAKGIISALMVIFAFAVSIIKPLRKRMVDWVATKAKTPDMLQRLDEIDKNLADVGKGMNELRDAMERHAKENSDDIARITQSQQMFTRGQIREIYRRNLTQKT